MLLVMLVGGVVKQLEVRCFDSQAGLRACGNGAEEPTVAMYGGCVLQDGGSLREHWQGGGRKAGIGPACADGEVDEASSKRTDMIGSGWTEKREVSLKIELHDWLSGT